MIFAFLFVCTDGEASAWYQASPPGGTPAGGSLHEVYRWSQSQFLHHWGHEAGIGLCQDWLKKGASLSSLSFYLLSSDLTRAVVQQSSYHQDCRLVWAVIKMPKLNSFKLAQTLVWCVLLGRGLIQRTALDFQTLTCFVCSFGNFANENISL